MNYTIRTYGNPVLRKKATQISAPGDAIQEMAEKMIAQMHANNGIGLAAEQVGASESICVIDIPPESDLDQDGQPSNPEIGMPLIMINPEITDASEEKIVAEEGCLSFPGLYGKVKRSRSVTVKYLDQFGGLHRDCMHELLARVAQHEIDHLNGILFIDRMSPVKRVSLEGKLKRLKKRTKRNRETM